jgi:hypothetical protein
MEIKSVVILALTQIKPIDKVNELNPYKPVEMTYVSVPHFEAFDAIFFALSV